MSATLLATTLTFGAGSADAARSGPEQKADRQVAKTCTKYGGVLTYYPDRLGYDCTAAQSAPGTAYDALLQQCLDWPSPHPASGLQAFYTGDGQLIIRYICFRSPGS